jgi:hypothetical protein
MSFNNDQPQSFKNTRLRNILLLVHTVNNAYRLDLNHQQGELS